MSTVTQHLHHRVLIFLETQETTTFLSIICHIFDSSDGKFLFVEKKKDPCENSPSLYLVCLCVLTSSVRTVWTLLSDFGLSHAFRLHSHLWLSKMNDVHPDERVMEGLTAYLSRVQCVTKQKHIKK